MTRGADLLGGLEARQRRILERCGELARERGETAYLVGGSVRDLVLGLPEEDLDVVVEGDGIAVAQALARDQDGVLTRYHTFQTARVDLPDSGGGALRVDVATARSEDYPRPGQLPRVARGTLREDLERRDFTINTMALPLGGPGEPELVDPFDGVADLRSGKVRVLHRRSFADDPTRILRALRFAVRFGYDLEEETSGWLDEAVLGGYLDTVTGARIRRELAYLFGEAPVEGPLALQRREVLPGIHPRLAADRGVLEALDELRAACRRGGADGTPQQAAGSPALERTRGGERAGAGAAELPSAPEAGWSPVLAACATELAAQERWNLARRLRLEKEERRPLVDAGVPWRRARIALFPGAGGGTGGGATAPGGPAPSAVDRALRDLDPGAVAVGAAVLDAAGEEAAAAAVRRWLVSDRHVAPALGGADLLALGVPEGPEIGRLLRRLRAGRLDGELRDRADEAAAVARWWERPGEGRGAAPGGVSSD